MPLFESLSANTEKTIVIYPLKYTTDEEWSYREVNGEKVPEIPFDWREVGFEVDIPDVNQMNFVSEKSLKYKAIKGVDQPVRIFNPDFIKNVCGVGGNKPIIKNWVGVEIEDPDSGDIVEMPLDQDGRQGLYKMMCEGLFLYTQFMKAYNELMGKVAKEEAEETEDEENF